MSRSLICLMMYLSFRFMITLGKAKGWGTFLKGNGGLWLPPILGPLFRECHHSRALPYELGFMCC
jgi:hypothetical protein